MTEQVHITIVGTGCVGSSLGLALHRAAEPVHIVGHDKDSRHAGIAQKMKAVDRTDWNLINACEKADLIVLALPLNAIDETLKAIAPYLKPGCVITDTASLKQPVIAAAARWLPDTVSFVGGNPLVNAPASGPDAARVDLFEGSLYCLTPAPSAHPDAVSLLSSVVALLGARPFYLDAAEHDGLMAGVAQLPQALALLVWHSTTRDAGWRDMRKLAGGALDAFGTLIGDDGAALADLLLSNRDHLLPWLDACADEINALRRLLAEGQAEALAALGERSIEARRDWMRDRKRQFAEELPLPPIEKPNLLHHIVPRRLLERK